MSAGNVSSGRANMDYFRQAVHLLRRASATPGFSLPVHLQRYVFQAPYNIQTADSRNTDIWKTMVDSSIELSRCLDRTCICMETMRVRVWVSDDGSGYVPCPASFDYGFLFLDAGVSIEYLFSTLCFVV